MNAPNLRVIRGGLSESLSAPIMGAFEADPFPGVSTLGQSARALLSGANPFSKGVPLERIQWPSSAATQTDPFVAPVNPQGPSQPKDLYSALAPWPAADRTPIVIGQGLSVGYLSAAMRLCTQGWRYQFVDCVNELTEHDPHMRGVLRQRIVPVSGARVEVRKADLGKGASKSEEDLAETIRSEVERQIRKIPRWTQALSGLAWGAWYGLSGSEILWRQGRDVKWEVGQLDFIHTRRLNLPRIDTWDVHVWDQGLVGPGIGYFGRTSGPYGLRCDDYPAKFILHSPQLNADYLTRDGEDRYCATYMLLKRMCVRASAQDFERTIRPWIVGYFRRDAEGDGEEEVANEKDITKLQSAVQSMGNGSLNTAVLSDAVRIEILRAASQYPLKDFLAFLDDAMSKGVLGQTYTTSPGAHGNHAVAEVAKECMLDVLRYDARCLADTLELFLVYWIVRLNWPGLEDRFCPTLVLNVDEETSPEVLIKLALDATRMDIPVDARDVCERAGLRYVDVGAEDYDPVKSPRTRLVSTNGMGGVQPTADNDPNELGDEAAQVVSADKEIEGEQGDGKAGGKAAPKAPKKPSAPKKGGAPPDA